MVLPISIHAIPTPIFRATPARVVEPVCEPTCNCDEFPPTNPFALPPMPFSKFLERENDIDTFQRRPAPPFPLIYSPPCPVRPSHADEHALGRNLDVLA
jgi:hypothetical protein